jgi:predicted MPP superfamily phosphohydrolase
MGEKYPSGRYQVGGMVQYTNRGVGMVRPHVRLNCRPEITLLTLQAVAR